MKEKDGTIDCPQQQVILYVEKEDGTYEPIQTGSYITKNYLDDYELKRRHLEESLSKKVQAGEVSPVYYFMVLNDLTLSELSARAGLRKKKVKAHLEPGPFKTLPAEMLQAYADVFNVTVQELVQRPLAVADDPKNLNPEH
jgi:hypothetical protein